MKHLSLVAEVSVGCRGRSNVNFMLTSLPLEKNRRQDSSRYFSSKAQL